MNNVSLNNLFSLSQPGSRQAGRQEYQCVSMFTHQPKADVKPIGKVKDPGIFSGIQQGQMT